MPVSIGTQASGFALNLTRTFLFERKGKSIQDFIFNGTRQVMTQGLQDIQQGLAQGGGAGGAPPGGGLGGQQPLRA